MRECRTYGSVRGARGDARPYRDRTPRTTEHHGSSFCCDIIAPCRWTNFARWTLDPKNSRGSMRLSMSSVVKIAELPRGMTEKHGLAPRGP